MCGDDTAIAESVVKELEIRLLEKGLGRALGVRRIGDNDVEGVLVVGQELESVSDMDFDLGVVVTGGHVGEVLLGEADDSLVVCVSQEGD